MTGEDRLTELSSALVQLQRPLKILRSLAWPEEVERRFFAQGERELPRPVYDVRLDGAAITRELKALRQRLVGENPVERLLAKTCDGVAAAVRMLGAIGTQEFYRCSSELYGHGLSLVPGHRTNVELARHFEQILDQYVDVQLGGEDEVAVEASLAAAELRLRFAAYFDDHPIRVEVIDGLAANAVAGADVVKLKRDARFKPRDVDQLEVHEGWIHVATTLNGRSQSRLPHLGASAPHTTRTQEGLATFTELITQTMDVDRLRRLTDRILAIHQAEQGADFLEVYRFFLSRGYERGAAFDCARRVFRGGRIEGGAPFTKDVCYLDGLIRVSNFLREALTQGRPDLVRLLFVGKLALDDLPALSSLARDGHVVAPRYVPPWARELRFLTAYMGYSSFLQDIDQTEARAYYHRLVDQSVSVSG